MSSENQGNFFDQKTIGAIVLLGVLFFGWQKYLEHKYPDFYKKKDAVTQETAKGADAPAAKSAEPQVPATSANSPLVAPTQQQNVTESVQNVMVPQMNFEVSSLGFGLKKITLENYLDRKGQKIQLGMGQTGALFEVGLIDGIQKIPFQVVKEADGSLSGVSSVGAMKITQKMKFVEEGSYWNSELVIENPPANFHGVSLTLAEPRIEGGSSSFLMPSMDHQGFVVKHEGTIDRIEAKSSKEDEKKSFSQVSMLALGSQYFASAVVDQSDILPEVELLSPLHGDLIGRLNYRVTEVKPQMVLKWKAFSGAKLLETLHQYDSSAGEIVNFGLFASIGKILLIVLRWFHGFVGNWGFSIIFLTVLVRLLVLPFNLASYKSMKKMQAIQPQLASLRERYKDDPTTMNRETMALMREQKVNPIGGCLPMLLQMPIFFALYQVLGQSIELYQAPFIFWIQDLSLKDPFYILPVLMGVTMFIQQKITPTTMDPQQAKILQWMPLLFSVFTVSLPAGLTLYIFVSTLFAVLQQQLFTNDKSFLRSKILQWSK